MLLWVCWTASLILVCSLVVWYVAHRYKTTLAAKEKLEQSLREDIEVMLGRQEEQRRLVLRDALEFDKRFMQQNYEMARLASDLKREQEHNEALTAQTMSVQKEVAETHTLLSQEQDKNRALHSQMKSSQVRIGKIAENLAPFLDDFPYDPEKCRFVGNPIDFICFDDDYIRVVEVKSGNAQLAKVQRVIRDQIAAGKITFEVYRVNGEEND